VSRLARRLDHDQAIARGVELLQLRGVVLQLIAEDQAQSGRIDHGAGGVGPGRSWRHRSEQ
jgi:hypothetical protein